ncbi:MAG: group II intron reverse transcriptase/maturase [Clostridiales bacterium]|nr:group II intron reverse transcriptase/maturase [Clostridiales bacterium]
MNNSTNMERKQKTSYEGCLGKIELDTRNKQEVFSDSVALSKKKAKSKIDTEFLLERIVARRNLYEAYKQVKRNRGSHGVDKMKVEELLPYLKSHATNLIESLLNGTYKPKPVRRIEIPKPDGGIRLLGIPTVIDRMIQQAITRELNGIFEPIFSENSFGFRPKRSCHMALKKSKEFIESGYKIVVDIDLEKFFDRVNHDILMNRIAKRVRDKRVLKLIRLYLYSGIMQNGIVVKSEEGTVQGGPISPLLSNILLDGLDKELEKRGHKYVRYADGCNIYLKSRRAGERVLKSITKFLERKLKLKVNEKKSAVDAPTKRKFLEDSFYYSRGGIRFRVHKGSLEKFKRKIKGITNRNVSMHFDYRIKKLSEVIIGWVNYYKLADMKTRLKELDEWIRRRLRACIWKTWKKVRTRFKNLKKLGLDKCRAWQYANTRKGYWRMSNSPVLNRTITNDKLIRRGFKSLSSQYQKIRLS